MRSSLLHGERFYASIPFGDEEIYFNPTNNTEENPLISFRCCQRRASSVIRHWSRPADLL